MISKDQTQLTPDMKPVGCGKFNVGFGVAVDLISIDIVFDDEARRVVPDPPASQQQANTKTFFSPVVKYLAA